MILNPGEQAAASAPDLRSEFADEPGPAEVTACAG